MLIQSEGATTSKFDGVTYLFLEQTQQLCALTEASAAFFARCRAGALVSEHSLTDEHRAVAQALLEAGALDIVAHSDGEASVAVTETIELAGACITLCFGSESAHDLLMSPFADLKAVADRSDAQIVIVEADGKIGIACANDDLVWVDYVQSVPVLKMAITEAFMMAAEGLLIHAATTVAGSQAMLLLGGPGAGKSTLALALSGAQLQIAGDDLVMLEKDGRARPLRLPATLKPGSWSLLGETFCEIEKAPTYQRLDGQDARYIQLAVPDADGPFGVCWIVLLDRQDGAEACLSDVPVDEVFAVILGASWSGANDLEAEEFRAIATCLEKARIVRLTYSHLDGAVHLLNAMCAKEARVLNDHLGHQT